MDQEVIAHLPGCEGGNCATFWRHRRTGAVTVRGLDPTDPAGERELDVVISAEDWAHLTAQLPR